MDRVDPVSELEQMIATMDSLMVYETMTKLIGRCRQRRMSPNVYEEHVGSIKQLWIVYDVFKLSGRVYYWLLSPTPLFSYAREAEERWERCNRLAIGPTPDYIVNDVAHPAYIRPYIDKPEALHMVRRDRGRANFATSRRWSYTGVKLPLGIPYRAIDVGSLIPVFNLPDGTVAGLTIK